jgi:hypothetical protein
MLSRTGNHLFWMAGGMELAARARGARDKGKALRRVPARSGFLGPTEIEDAV